MNFELKQGTIRIEACSMNNFSNYNRYIFIGKDGQILKEQQGEQGEYVLSGSELYVRVQVASEHGAMLWTQPVYDESQFERV